MNESPLEISVVTKDVHPDTASVKVGRLVAGAAIDDHFLDTVLPTLAVAMNNQRDRVLAAADKSIKEKLDGDLRPIVEPLLKKIVQEAIAKHGDGNGRLTIELYDPTNERTEYMSRQHFMFPVLLRLLCIVDRNQQPLNIAVVGPAGNGKTSMALSCADALGIGAVLQPFNPQTTKSDLLGYMSANGTFVPSPFYEAFTKGKLFIADEFDAANPAIAVTLNAAVANRTLTFPNLETVRAHPHFRAVFIMNTGGTGADHQYTGRMRQDGATLDRLVQLHVPIDKGLEAAIANIDHPSETVDIGEGGRFGTTKQILSLVQRFREAVETLNMKYIVSPRATLHATAMHAGGFGKKWIMECCLWRGMPKADRDLIAQEIGAKDDSN